MSNIYTIGFQDFVIDDFINLLKQKGITFLIDIRSKPYSDRYPAYNKDNLKTTLADCGIAHESFAREFGARQENPDFYTNGQMDFDLFGKSPVFIGGVNKVIDLINNGETVVLMCHESDPIDCHRAILCGRAFFDREFNVIHLLSKETAITQETIHQRMIEKYFPHQVGVAVDCNYQLLLEKVYKEQNKVIGFRR
ncbi:MAG: DUF488 domain-containing protein [Ruminococcus sp.]|nr:DUF488 domain-containing protein [Ruminococcus sp.]